jgi:hypothetical protein
VNPEVEAVSPTRAKVFAVVAALVLALGVLFAANVNWSQPAAAAGLCPTKISNSVSSTSAIQVRENLVVTTWVTISQGQTLNPPVIGAKRYCYFRTVGTHSGTAYGNGVDVNFGSTWKNISAVNTSYTPVKVFN